MERMYNLLQYENPTIVPFGLVRSHRHGRTQTQTAKKLNALADNQQVADPTVETLRIENALRYIYMGGACFRNQI